jgi:proline iminopeptidase
MKRMRRILPLLLGAAVLLGGASTDRQLSVGPHSFMSDAVTLRYRAAGRSDGIPVIYLHGSPAEGSQGFARTVGPMLEKSLRMIYLDQRGAGHSDRPVETSAYSMAILVADLEKLRQHLGVPKMALVGHSYGATLALEYAAKYPANVSKIVLISAMPDVEAALNLMCGRLKQVDAAAYVKAKAALAGMAGPDCFPMMGYDGKAAKTYFDTALGDAPGTLDRLAQADKDEGVKISGPAHNALMEETFGYRFKATDAITMPVLAISGGRDGVADPAPVAALVAKMPRGKMLRYPDAGHFLYVEQPERFSTDLVHFLGAK